MDSMMICHPSKVPVEIGGKGGKQDVPKSSEKKTEEATGENEKPSVTKDTLLTQPNLSDEDALGFQQPISHLEKKGCKIRKRKKRKKKKKKKKKEEKEQRRKEEEEGKEEKEDKVDKEEKKKKRKKEK